MAATETELEMVQRHIREGDADVERQREIVARLRGRDAPIENVASALLASFEDLLGQHKAHLARLEDKGAAHHV